MPKKLYTLDPEGKQILEVTWRGNFKNLEIKLNNKLLGTIENKEELTQGKNIEISHSKNLSIKLVKEMYIFTELEILLNSQPITGSMTHPVKRLNDVFWLIIFIASVNLLFGLLGIISDISFFERLGLGFWNIIYGGIFILLGLMVREKKSMFAMLTIIMLMFIDIIASFMFLNEYPNPANPTGSIIFKLALILFLLRGIRAIKDYKKMEAENEALLRAEEGKKNVKPLSEQVTEDHNKFMPDDHSGYLPG